MAAAKSTFVYMPSASHKVETTEAGPPQWIPYKEKCPPGLTFAERQKLLDESVAEDGSSTNPRRYALRRTTSGVEFFESKVTRSLPNGRIEVHGHPTRRVPPKVLRALLAKKQITSAEYNYLRKNLKP